MWSAVYPEERRAAELPLSKGDRCMASIATTSSSPRLLSLVGMALLRPPQFLGTTSLKQRFSRIRRNNPPRRVSQPHNLPPVIARRRIGRNQRPKRHSHLARPRQPSLVPQNLPRPRHRHRTNRALRIHRRLESAQLKRPYPHHRRERAFRINRHGLASLERRIHLVRLLDARLCAPAIERKLPAPPRQRTEKRHLQHFALGNESHAARQIRERHQNVQIARMVRREDARTSPGDLAQHFAS